MPRKQIKSIAHIEEELRMLIVKLKKYKKYLRKEIHKTQFGVNGQRLKGYSGIYPSLKEGEEVADMCLSALKLVYRANNLADEYCEPEEFDTISDVIGSIHKE